jgi:cytochrome c peroxidase
MSSSKVVAGGALPAIFFLSCLGAAQPPAKSGKPREIARTALYMHDGSLKTLEDVVEYYDKGGTPNRNLDQRIKPLHLTDRDKKDLVAFLNALSGEDWQKITAPEKFPE